MDKKNILSENSSEMLSGTNESLNTDESSELLTSLNDRPSVSSLPKSEQSLHQLGQMASSTKPILTRQDPIINLVSPQLSITTLGRSNEDANSEDSQTMKHTRDSQNESETPIISLSFDNNTKNEEPFTNNSNKDLPFKNVCKMCKANEKDAFSLTTNKFMMKTNSKDSISNQGRFTLYLTKHYSSYSPSSALHTSSPLMGSRVIRQSSQPEEGSANYCVSNCPHNAPNYSLRQSKEGNEGIAEIAADSLRFNGVMKPFRQVSFMFNVNVI